MQVISNFRGPGAFVAEGDLRELRIASRELRSVVDERSDLKRRLKSHLAQLGLGFSASDWASTPGRLRIAKLVQEVEREHGVRGESVARLWDRIRPLGDRDVHADRTKPKGTNEPAEMTGTAPPKAA